MNYKVVPFTANIQRNGNASQASEQLQKAISQNTSEGWKFHSLEDLTTDVAPDNGCFGIGAKPGYTISVQCLVFEKE